MRRLLCEDFFLWGVVVLLTVLIVWGTIRNFAEIGEESKRVGRLEAEVASLKQRPAPPDHADELVKLKQDIDVCHQRADDIWGALGVVARTVPGRARPPRIPKRERP
jgi:hypothetical protein